MSQATALEQAQYPEHEKLRIIKDQSQCCGEFIEWLATQGFHVVAQKRENLFVLQRALAEFFDIDEDTLDEEKRAMLEKLNQSSSANRQRTQRHPDRKPAHRGGYAAAEQE